MTPSNPIPGPWLFALVASLALALGLWFHYGVFHSGETPARAYERVYGTVTPAELIALSQDATAVREGHDVFARTCAPCHAPTGGGLVGPNLTDEFWLHGGAPQQIYASVGRGYAANGMPEWLPSLGPATVQAVTAYVLTLRNTHVPGGKPPQGQREP
jgi:cytochrome c oxidase cbb3-type subunit 3